MRFVIALAVALIVANQASVVQADEKSDQIYDLVMEHVATYASLNEPKVMAICIDWDAPTVLGIHVHNVFVTYTGVTSDRPIFAGQLAQDVKRRCKKWAKSEKIDCTCQMMDKNGKNVLKVPARD